MGYQEAMEKAGAEVLSFQYFGSYQGEFLTLVNYKEKKFWVTGSYGSCSGCDSFQAEFDGSYTQCENHYYENDEITANCEDCKLAASDFDSRLAKFGVYYLENNNYSQEEIEKYIQHQLDQEYCFDREEYQSMLDFVRREN